MKKLIMEKLELPRQPSIGERNSSVGRSIKGITEGIITTSYKPIAQGQ